MPESRVDIDGICQLATVIDLIQSGALIVAIKRRLPLAPSLEYVAFSRALCTKRDFVLAFTKNLSMPHDRFAPTMPPYELEAAFIAAQPEAFDILRTQAALQIDAIPGRRIFSIRCGGDAELRLTKLSHERGLIRVPSGWDVEIRI